MLKKEINKKTIVANNFLVSRVVFSITFGNNSGNRFWKIDLGDKLIFSYKCIYFYMINSLNAFKIDEIQILL